MDYEHYEKDIDEDEIEFEKNNELAHYGIKRRSGRYPWGSGEEPFQSSGDFYTRMKELKKEGFTEKELADFVNLTTTEFKLAYATATNNLRADKVAYAKSLRADGLSNVEIGKKVGEKYNDGKPIGESTIRSFFNEDAEARTNIARKTSEELKSIVDSKNFIDIGKGSETQLNKGLGISGNKLDQAVSMLEMDGYEVYTIKIPQVTNRGKWTNLKILCKPNTKYKEAYDAAMRNEVKPIYDFSENITRDDEKPNRFIYPSSLDSKRIKIRYAEEGGTDKDGVVELRRGVPDLSLGTSLYSQVRILVDDNYYIKGMAVYGNDKDFPEGVDVIVNSNKFKSKIGEDKHAALKETKDNLIKDPTNPFGAAIKQNGGQSFYDDPNGKYTDPITGKRQSLSKINKRSDEGDWDAWSKELSAQFLAKQPMKLIKRQLKISQDDAQAEFNEIMSLTNPVIKKKMLLDFASDCDSAAVHLKAAALPGQTYKVILPLTTLKDDQVYAPTLENGTKVALVRFPHGGTFEIPILTVNNLNKEGKEVLTSQATDAIGITKNVADRLSGADFDGDSVLMIPLSDEIQIASKRPLKELEGFDTKLAYGPDPGSENKVTINGKDYGIRNGQMYTRMTQTQKQMGMISNLITDMTLLGATEQELARAVKHSMVVIDAEKHWLDYKSSERENGIKELKDKYQGKIDPITGEFKSGGVGTLLSRAKSKVTPLERKEGAPFVKDTNERVTVFYEDEEKRLYRGNDTGNIYESKDIRILPSDPKTGEKVYTYTGRKYYQVKLPGVKQPLKTYYDKEGKMFYYKPKEDGSKGDITYITNEKVLEFDAPNVESSSRMYEAKDARELLSLKMTQQEEAYAEYANKLKSLANEARKMTYLIEDKPYSPEANKIYKEEVKSLEYKYNQALANKPKERQAQLLAQSRIKAILQDNPGIDDDHLSKKKTNALKEARLMVGAERKEIYITDKEWEAIQAGAISKTRLSEIITKADSDRLKALALPRDQFKISNAKIDRIKSLSKNGYNISEIAKHLGISVSTVNSYLNGKENK